MKKIISFNIIILVTVFIFGCQNSKNEDLSEPKENTTVIKKEEIKTKIADTITKNKVSDFIPNGFKIFDQIKGDLNKDGIDDCVLIIKATHKDKIVNDEHHGELDRNRRGIIVLLNENGNYKMKLKNTACFSSENEEGGVYFPPDMSVNIMKGNIYVHYAHGRYGWWRYTFRIKNSDFDLIGYDSSNDTGGMINSETSINFLTKKKIYKKNINQNGEINESLDEVFEESIEKINITKIYKLSEIEDFDELTIDEI